MTEERQEIEHDGSVEAAASLISDADLGSPVVDEAPRSENGQYAKKTVERVEEEAETEPGDNDKPSEIDAKADEPDEPEGDDEEEDYVEIPADEEGAEPTRLKLSELIEAHTKAQELEGQVAEARKSQPLPADYEIAVQETVAIRDQYAQALQQWAQFNPLGNPPDEAMLDPASQSYDPERYRTELIAFNQRRQQHATAKAEYDELKKQNEAEQQKIHRSQVLRARDEIATFWPELADKQTNHKVRSDLETFYGIKSEDLATIVSPTAWKIIKDALAHRSSKPAVEKAVKAVKGKPKLVPAKARKAASSPAKQRAAQARERLAKTGSLDDAADALEAFL